jgi:ribosomal protein L40E/DNA-directed RNA polymerase subunit RPC12/RpoP
MIVFPCHICRTSLSAEEGQAGQMLRCPVCRTTLRVPVPEAAMAGVAGAGAAVEASGQAQPRLPMPGTRFSGKRYGFNCGYCSSRLEATESMAAQEGQCPTCGNQITIPILDRYGRLIDPKTRQIIKQDPHPVHAYAAAGARAPKIRRAKDGKQQIVCPRCAANSPITANNCKSCGMPFTMEGTTLEAAGTNNGFCVASLVLGIIGIPALVIVIPALLAIIFGIVGLNQINKPESATRGGKGMAIAGISCGSVACLIALIAFVKML